LRTVSGKEGYSIMRDTIVLGASLGGVEALSEIVARLPRHLPATVLAVLHVGRHHSALPSLLSGAGPLPARHARDGELLELGTIYVAPPDRHLAIAQNRARVFRGPKENFARPAIDPLFRSAAISRGPRVIAAVLTGLLDDGSAGLQAVRACGGMTIAQDPASAAAAEMPENAIRAAGPDYVLPLAAIGAKLAELAGTPEGAAAAASDTLIGEDDAARGRADIAHLSRIAAPSTYACPACGGTLWQIADSRPPRYRCHIGHAYGARSLEWAKQSDIETACGQALRVLHENAALSIERAAYHMDLGEVSEADRCRSRAARAAEAATLLEQFMREGDPDAT
jgi:two-component system chemotaxis response regulator CheB